MYCSGCNEQYNGNNTSSQHGLCGLDRGVLDRLNFTGYIKHLGLFQSIRRYGTRRARSAVFTWSQLQHHRGYASMVSTWMDTQCRLRLVLAMLVKLAQACVGAVGFFMAPIVHVCRDNEASGSARTITSWHKKSTVGCLYLESTPTPSGFMHRWCQHGGIGSAVLVSRVPC